MTALVARTHRLVGPNPRAFDTEHVPALTALAEPLLREPTLANMRRAALEVLTQGLPSGRHEEYRYTNPQAYLRACVQQLPADAAPAPAAPTKGVLVRAGNVQVGALPAGVDVYTLQHALQAVPHLLRTHLGHIAQADVDPMTALNTALFSDAVVVVARGHVPEPVVLSFDETSISVVRVLVVAEPNSHLQLHERYEPAAANAVHNVVTEVNVGAGAEVEHVRLQRQGPTTHHWGRVAARQEADSHFESHSLVVRSGWSRVDIDTELWGEHAHATLLGLYVAGGDAHVDHSTRVGHRVPHCTSEEVYRGVARDSARAVFCGKIVVSPKAQKTDAAQSNKALLLGRHARVDTKPQLEVYADDVKCAHGAAVGQLDESALFYLRQRGLDAAAARGLLTVAFVREVLGRVPSEPLREELEQELWEAVAT